MSQDCHEEEIQEPQNGGCWYCSVKDDDLEVCREFDTYVHRECVQHRLEDDPEDREAQLIMKDLNID